MKWVTSHGVRYRVIDFFGPFILIEDPKQERNALSCSALPSRLMKKPLLARGIKVKNQKQARFTQLLFLRSETVKK